MAGYGKFSFLFWFQIIFLSLYYFRFAKWQIFRLDFLFEWTDLGFNVFLVSHGHGPRINHDRSSKVEGACRREDGHCLPEPCGFNNQPSWILLCLWICTFAMFGHFIARNDAILFADNREITVEKEWGLIQNLVNISLNSRFYRQHLDVPKQ